jgi:hypothetical protein
MLDSRAEGQPIADPPRPAVSQLPWDAEALVEQIRAEFCIDAEIRWTLIFDRQAAI